MLKYTQKGVLMHITIHDDSELPLYLDVILDSLETIKSQQYLTLLMHWNKLFKDIDVKINIHIPDSESYLSNNSNLTILCEPKSYFETNEVIQNKNVYGKNYSIISTKMILQTNQEIILVKKQISSNSICKIYKKALEGQYKKILKNLENQLTYDNSFGIF